MNSSALAIISDYDLGSFLEARSWVAYFKQRNIKAKAKPYLNKISKFTCSIDKREFSNLDLGLREADKIKFTAEVKGTSRYETTVLFFLKKDDTVVINAACGCPVGNSCKHAYALLEYVSKELGQIRMEVDNENILVKSWLKKVSQATTVPQKVDLVGARPAKKAQFAPLGYVIRPSYYDSGLTMSYARVAPLDHNGNFEVVNPSLKLTHGTRRYYLEEDEGLLQLIHNTCSEQYYGRDVIIPEGEALLLLLKRLVASGRLFIGDEGEFYKGELVSAVRIKESLECQLGWKDLPKGRRKPVLLPKLEGKVWVEDPYFMLDDSEESSFGESS